ncbi:nucleoid-associated protein [Aquabacterium humicola]|uniref:nucleoid-associated protein n=1 Tax=Aquabacterium humicola TaxID=3237377 RepID=UPI0025430CC1|nr:nucleoid-associated protein [Rubrivivax pictus]
MNKVEAAVIHKLAKERHGKATVVTRDSPLGLTASVVKLVTDVHDLYADKPGKGFGRFEADEVSFPAAAILRNYLQHGTTSFVDASKVLMSVLANRASPVALATGGFVLMAHMSGDNGMSWFVVAIITNVQSTAVNEANMDVVDTVHVDMQNLRVAGRVNIGDWLGGDPDARYLGFLKQKGGVSDYFRSFLGCSELVDSAAETKKLLDELKSFAIGSAMTEPAREEFLQRAHDFCVARQRSDEPLSLESLCNAVQPDEPKALQQVLAKAKVQINDGFVPDGRVLKSFLRIKARTAFWSVDIERHLGRREGQVRPGQEVAYLLRLA